MRDAVGEAAITRGPWMKSLTWAGSWGRGSLGQGVRGQVHHPMPYMSVRHWLWRGYQDLVATVQKPCPLLALLKKGQRPRPQADPILDSLCLVIRGRQAAPRCHPPHAPGTFRPARDMSNVQIPQVMREFVTRGAWAIQEWEPDRGPEQETQTRPASEGSGCSERAPWEEERTAGWSPLGRAWRGLLPPCS